jgi:hypothetical protein
VRIVRIFGVLIILGCLLGLLQAANVNWRQQRTAYVCHSKNGHVLELAYAPDFGALEAGCDYVIKTLGNPVPRARGHYPSLHCTALLTDWRGQGPCEIQP